MINILLIVLALITLVYGLMSLKNNVENYTTFYETGLNEAKKLNKLHMDILNTRNVINNTKRENIYNTFNQNLALLNALKIFDKVNKYTYQLKNLYDVCYKNGDPCNTHCRQIMPSFCKITKN